MRGASLRVLVFGLSVLAASPAFAQPPGPPGGPGGFPGGGGFRAGGGGFNPGGAGALLNNEKVLEELKISDNQKADIKKATDEAREKTTALLKTQGEETEKAIREVLKPEQAKRLHQIEVQMAGVDAFNREDVQTALKLSDKQKAGVKDALAELQKDVQDLFKDAQGDPQKMGDALKKIQGLRTDTVQDIVKELDDGQKTTWKDLTGDKFEVAAGPGGFGPGGGFRAGGGFRPGGGGVQGVLESLKLSDEQKDKAKDIVQASAEKERAQRQQAREDLLKQLKGVLDDEQYKQLKDQLDRQGGPGRPGATPGGGR